MEARIYKRPKNAMQSGKALTDQWVLDFVPAEAKRPDPAAQNATTNIEYWERVYQEQGYPAGTARQTEPGQYAEDAFPILERFVRLVLGCGDGDDWCAADLVLLQRGSWLGARLYRWHGAR